MKITMSKAKGVIILPGNYAGPSETENPQQDELEDREVCHLRSIVIEGAELQT